MKISMSSLALALLAETAVAVNGGCKTGYHYCGKTLDAMSKTSESEMPEFAQTALADNGSGGYDYQTDMEGACRSGNPYPCAGERVLDVLFLCYVDGNGDADIEMKDFACEKKCVDGGQGQDDYCSEKPATIITHG